MTLYRAQREFFTSPQLLSPAWTLRKGAATAECTVWSHQLGHELRLVISGDDLPRTHVVRDQAELIRVQDEWRLALEAKGWIMANRQQCPVCKEAAGVAWHQNYRANDVDCATCGGSFVVHHEMLAPLAEALEGKGALKGRLPDLQRAIRERAITELETPQQVVAELDAFLEGDAR